MAVRYTRAYEILSALLMLFAFHGTGNGQILYGSITGNVKDPSGVAVAGAQVQVENPTTGFQRQTTSNNEGIYLIGDLPPGTYNVTVSSQAFAKAIINGVPVSVNQTRRADASLQMAQMNQVVEITAAPPALQTDRADVNVNISTRQLESLPITGSGGRNFQSLLTIVPGTSISGPQNSAAAEPGASHGVPRQCHPAESH